MSWLRAYWATPKGRFWTFAGGVMAMVWGVLALALWDRYRGSPLAWQHAWVLPAWLGGWAVSSHLVLGAAWILVGVWLVHRSGYLREFDAWARTSRDTDP